MSTEQRNGAAQAAVPTAIDAEVALTWKQVNERVERAMEPRYDSVKKGGGQVRIVPRRPGSDK